MYTKILNKSDIFNLIFHWDDNLGNRNLNLFMQRLIFDNFVKKLPNGMLKMHYLFSNEVNKIIFNIYQRLLLNICVTLNYYPVILLYICKEKYFLCKSSFIKY